MPSASAKPSCTRVRSKSARACARALSAARALASSSAWELVEYFGRLYGLDRERLRVRMEEVFASLQMNDFRDTLGAKMSTGMRQKVSIARAIIHDPSVLIFDEPTAGLDVELRIELWEFLKRINTGGMTVFLTSHYLEEVEMLCSRIGIINGGKLVALEDKKTLIAKRGQGSLQEVFLELVGSRVRE